MSDDPQATRSALRKIGRAPRLVLGLLSVAAVAIALIGGESGLHWSVQVLLAGAPCVGLLFAFRIRAEITPHAFVVRSYMRTYSFPFVEVDGIGETAYAGVWNRFAGSDSWANFGARMLEVDTISRPMISLPSTLCGRRTSTFLTAVLNDRLAEVRGFSE